MDLIMKYIYLLSQITDRLKSSSLLVAPTCRIYISPNPDEAGDCDLPSMTLQLLYPMLQISAAPIVLEYYRLVLRRRKAYSCSCFNVVLVSNDLQNFRIYTRTHYETPIRNVEWLESKHPSRRAIIPTVAIG